jgi:hypothetical protein
MDKAVKWILAIGAVVIAARSVRDAYVGNLADAGVTPGSTEGILGQRGRARRLYFERHPPGGGVNTNPAAPCSSCAENPASGCC